MNNKILLGVIFVLSLIIVSCGTNGNDLKTKSESEINLTEKGISSSERQTNSVSSENTGYGNAIDDILLPLINDENKSQGEIREYEDAYCKAWKNEYSSITKHLMNKCSYKDDKTNIKNMKKNISAYIEDFKKVIELEIINGYDYPSSAKSDITRDSLRGNGTRSKLNMIEGEIYRDACLSLFRNLDLDDPYSIVFSEDKLKSIME